MSRQLKVTVHDQGFIWSVRVDANPSGVKHRVRRLALLPTQLDIALELTWVRRLLTKKVALFNFIATGEEMPRVIKK